MEPAPKPAPAAAASEGQQEVLDHFPFMVWLKDADSRFLAVNRWVAAAAGAGSPAELRGRCDLDYFPQDLAEAYRADDREVLRTRSSKQVEEQIDDRGVRRWYETYKAPVEVDGVVVGTFGFAREIDGRKTAELALRESEKRYWQVMDNVSDLLCLAEVEPDGRCRILELSMSVERMSGTSRSRWVGRRIDEALDAAAGAVVLPALRACVAAGTPVEVDLPLQLADGTRHLHVALIPVRESASEPQRVLAVGRDVSLLRQHEEMLNERDRLQSRLKRLAEVAPGVVGTYRLDPRGRASIPPPSPKLEEITGCDAAAVAEDASAFVRSVHPDDVEAYRAAIAESAVRLTPWHHEFRVRHPRKGEIWLEGRSIPERLPDGSTEWYGFLHDVTGRKRVEAALRASERQYRELASRRASERELERKRIARELHDELGQSLTALRMRVSMLRVQFGAEQPALRESIAEMNRLVDRTIEAIRDTVASLRPAALDLGVGSALEWLVEEFTRHSGIPCALDVPEEDIALPEDAATAVFRIAQESLTNVQRHAQARQAQVRLRRVGPRLLLQVRDDGVGFDPAVAAGHLGLVGVRERVLALGGELAVTSGVGQGTSIEVRFPLPANEGDAP